MSRTSGPFIWPSTCPHSEHCSPCLSHLQQRVPHLFNLRRTPRHTIIMSQLNTSASLFTRSLLDDPSESLLWDRWTCKATTPQSRVFYPQAVPAERLQLFLRFELTLALATADEPSEEWIRKFDKLLEKAYYHFGVQPTASVVKKWLDYDVAQIVGLVAAHPAGRHLHQFSELVQRLAEMQEAFPDPKRLENLKTLLLNIASSVNALPLSSPDHSLDAAPADLIGFVGLDGELDEDLREELEERLNSSDMELDSSLLRPGTQTAHRPSVSRLSLTN